MKKSSTKTVTFRKLVRKKFKKSPKLFYTLSVILIVLLGAGFYAMGQVAEKNSQTNSAANVSKSPHETTSTDTLKEETQNIDQATTSNQSESPSSLNASYDGRAGPLTVTNPTTATYPEPAKKPFIAKLISSALTLRYETSWMSSTTLYSYAAEPEWYDGANIASVTINGYDTSKVTVAADMSGAPKAVITISVSYIGPAPQGNSTTVPSGTSTAQITATDEYGRTSSTQLAISWL